MTRFALILAAFGLLAFAAAPVSVIAEEAEVDVAAPADDQAAEPAEGEEAEAKEAEAGEAEEPK